MNSTIECTRLWGCTSTSMRSPGRPNRWCASITSRPLFIRVAESTEIFGPIDHFGCLTASATVTLASDARERPRNGPPDAVRMIRASPLPAPPVASRVASGRHWKIALCSLSIGTTVAPPSRAAAMSNSPASTRDSLLASNRRLPARAAARVDGSPAAPTIAATTVSQASPAANASIAAVPACGRVVSPAAARPSRRLPKHASSAITACSGRCTRHSATSASTLRPAPSTVARRRCGCRAITSSAEVPMEPVAPRTAMSCRAATGGAATTFIRSPSTPCPVQTPAGRRAHRQDDPSRRRGRE